MDYTANKEKVDILILTAPWVYGTSQYLDILQKKLQTNLTEVNIDADPIIADKYNVVILPTIVITRNGYEFSRFNGFVPFDLVCKSFRIAKDC